MSDLRPLPRSLDPLPGESLRGFLLRLACRLHISPLRLACLTGCTSGKTTLRIGYQSLLDLDLDNFAQATRLTITEAEALTLRPWASRYPPIGRSRDSAAWPTITDSWLVRPGLRYCPACLVGDGSSIQRQYGGPWKTYWLLPIAFACLRHQRFLHEGCPQGHLHLVKRSCWELIQSSRDSTLRPAQCRHRMPERPGSPAGGSVCGVRLDMAAGSDESMHPSRCVLDAQQSLLSMLDDPRPADKAARAFADIRLIVALLHASWPLGRDLMDPSLVVAAERHVRRLNRRTTAYQALDQPPGNVLAAAGLLTAAIAILDSPDLPGIVARHIQASRLTSEWSPWPRILDRHRSACSLTLRAAGERVTGPSQLLPRPRGHKAPARVGGYRPEHIPALLEQQWYCDHFARFGYRVPTTIRRAGAILLVRRASGGSLLGAAGFLGIPFDEHHPHSLPIGLRQCLREHGPGGFTAALDDLAAQLDATPGLVNYQRRRQAMREWCLDHDTWQEIVNRLQTHPNGTRPDISDRKRQEASVFVWARVTHGEPRNAPRPIAAVQPEHVRRTWVSQRNITWAHFTRPGSSPHYAGLCKLLIEHAARLAKDIDGKSAN